MAETDGSSQSNTLPKFSLFLMVVLPPLGSRGLETSQPQGQAPPQLLLAGFGGKQKLPLCARKGKRKPGCLWKPFFLFPALVSPEHPARTVGFKAPARGEPCLTHGLKNAHSPRITQTL